MKMRVGVLATMMALTVGLAACSPGGPGGSATATSGASGQGDTASTGSDQDKAVALVNGASHGRATALKVFDGPGGLRGIVTQAGGPNGQKEIVWASPDLTVLIPGQAIDKNGQGLNEQALNDQGVYKSAAAVADEVVEKAGEQRSFIVGTKGPVVTAFMDANCIFCHKFYMGVMPDVKAGKVRVRFVMVGFLKPSSVPRAVAILGSKNPAAALDKDERNFNEAQEEGGIDPLKGDQSALQAVVASNTQFMASFGPISTPVMLACVAGKPVSIVRGMPQDIPGFVASLDQNPTTKACQ